MDDPALLAALAPTAAQLLDRHVSVAHEWFPHELVDAHHAPENAIDLPAGLQSALVVNLLTEDNLPFYFAALLHTFGDGGAWGHWVRRWTAEEMRHATAIRAYVTHVHAVDLRQLERDRMAHVQAAAVPTAATVADALVYLTLQELATRIAHGNTGRALPDTAGRTVMAKVSADENLHHLFYRDLVTAALDVAPSQTVIAISRQIRHFAMPGAAIPGFRQHAAAIAEAGVYSTPIFLEQVVLPLALRHWDIDHIDDLSPEAELARRRLHQFVDRLGRLAGRLTPHVTIAPTGAVAIPPGSS